MLEIRTNRDFYLLVQRIRQDFPDIGSRPLQYYLQSLWKLGMQRRDEQLNAHIVAQMLYDAISEVPVPFCNDWLNVMPPPNKGRRGTYAEWENMIHYQIADLHQMNVAGQLDNEHRYFGLQSPGGDSWYNFDPLSYIECGIRGTLGGYVADEVTVLDGSGDSEIFLITQYGWLEFTDLLGYGQAYE
jgi:hypothetical protein